MAVSIPPSQAATFWTGTNVTWTKSGATPSDTILAGKVVLARGGRDVLFNMAAGETAATITTASPKGTLWAFGNSVTATNFSSCTGLVYQSLSSLRNGDLATRILNKPMFLRLTNDDIYISIRFTIWGTHGAGTVSYTRSTPPSAVPPTVSISSPSANAVFAAPANVALKANASVSGGTVTNVSYFAGANSLGRATVPPFSVTASNLAAGAYSLTAVATASGISATSGAVSITVVSPIDVSLSSPGVSNGMFSFSYTADPGLAYVVQRASGVSSSNSFDWAPVVTNVALSNPVLFSESLTTNVSRYYRIGRMPNP